MMAPGVGTRMFKPGHNQIPYETQINFLALLLNVFTGDGVRVQSHKRGFGF